MAILFINVVFWFIIEEEFVKNPRASSQKQVSNSMQISRKVMRAELNGFLFGKTQGIQGRI